MTSPRASTAGPFRRRGRQTPTHALQALQQPGAHLAAAERLCHAQSKSAEIAGGTHAGLVRDVVADEDRAAAAEGRLLEQALDGIAFDAAARPISTASRAGRSRNRG